MIQHKLDRKRDKVLITVQLDLGEAVVSLLDSDRTTTYQQRLHEQLALVESEIMQSLAILASGAEEGEVKFFRDDLGYGFICGYDQQDIFVHRRQIRSDGYKTLQAQQRVRFKRRWGRQGFEAVDVEVL